MLSLHWNGKHGPEQHARGTTRRVSNTGGIPGPVYTQVYKFQPPDISKIAFAAEK
jgi:hypothetical protein